MAKIKKHNLRIITDDFVYLEDGGQGLSITNDVHDVVRRLHLQFGIGTRRIFYRDEYGHIDEIILKDGHFSHYASADESPFLDKILSILQPDWGAQ